jgi:hypothetical protein
MSAFRPMELLRIAPASAVAAMQVSVAPTLGSPIVSIPILLTPGRDGFGPSLVLTHGGHDPLSPFAHGWSLAGLPSIEIDGRDGLPEYYGSVARSSRRRWTPARTAPLRGRRPRGAALARDDQGNAHARSRGSPHRTPSHRGITTWLAEEITYGETTTGAGRSTSSARSLS